MQFSFVADRYQYLAGIGGDGGDRRRRRARRGQTAGGGAEGRNGSGRGGADRPGRPLTWRQGGGIYQDGVTFFSHVVAHNPTAREAHRQSGRGADRGGTLGKKPSPPSASLWSWPRRRPASTPTWEPRWSCWIRMDEGRGAVAPRSGAQSTLDLMPCRIWLRDEGHAETPRRSARPLPPPRRGQPPPQPENAHTRPWGTALFTWAGSTRALDALEHALALDPRREDIRTNPRRGAGDPAPPRRARRVARGAIAGCMGGEARSVRCVNHRDTGDIDKIDPTLG